MRIADFGRLLVVPLLVVAVLSWFFIAGQSTFTYGHRSYALLIAGLIVLFLGEFAMFYFGRVAQVYFPKQPRRVIFSGLLSLVITAAGFIVLLALVLNTRGA